MNKNDLTWFPASSFDWTKFLCRCSHLFLETKACSRNNMHPKTSHLWSHFLAFSENLQAVIVIFRNIFLIYSVLDFFFFKYINDNTQTLFNSFCVKKKSSNDVISLFFLIIRSIWRGTLMILARADRTYNYLLLHWAGATHDTALPPPCNPPVCVRAWLPGVAECIRRWISHLHSQV